MKGNSETWLWGRALLVFVVALSALAQTDERVEEPDANVESGRQTTLTPDPLALPAWSAADERAFARGRPVNLGGGLWPANVFPLQPVPPSETPALPVEATAVAGAPTVPSPPIIGKFDRAVASSYFAEPPANRVVDPQKLLPEPKARELERFLAQQAREARFDVCLLVFGGGQELPDDIDLDDVFSRWFGANHDSVLVAYFLGEPHRVHVIFSPQTRHQFRAKDLDAITVIAISQASASPYPTSQLDSFLLQLSISLFALEKTPPVMAAMTGMARPPSATATNNRPLLSKTGWIWLAPAAVAVGLVVRWWRHRRRRRLAFYLADREFVVRLGAPHSGGAGAVISWE
jgi:hypothetical protein